MRALDTYRSVVGMDSWETHDLLSIGRRRKFGAGEVLLSQGPAASYSALIVSGLVKVTAVSQADGDAFMGIRGPGDLLGEESAVTSGPPHGSSRDSRTVVATALTVTSAQVFPAVRLRRFLEEHPPAMFAVARGLCERLADAEERVVSAARDNADRRLARLLCDLERYGQSVTLPGRSGKEATGTQIPVRLTQAELASWIGACRETVDRALRRWRARKIVTTRYRAIIIHDLEALARIAGIQVTRRTRNWPAALPQGGPGRQGRPAATRDAREASVQALRKRLLGPPAVDNR